MHEYKGYIGVYHQVGPQGTDGRTCFFLSLFAYGHTLGLQSFATIQDLLMVLEEFHTQEER